MITEIFIKCSSPEDEEPENGLNIQLSHCEDDKWVEIRIVDDGEAPLFPLFSILLSELKRAVDKL